MMTNLTEGATKPNRIRCLSAKPQGFHGYIFSHCLPNRHQLTLQPPACRSTVHRVGCPVCTPVGGGGGTTDSTLCKGTLAERSGHAFDCLEH